MSGGPRLVTYLALCDRLYHSHGAAPRRGGRHNSNLAANNTLSLLMNTPFGTR